MSEEIDFIKLIDGYTFYRYDYADFLYKNLKERDDKLEEKDKEIERLNKIIDIKTDRIQQLMKRLSKRQEKVDKLNKIIDITKNNIDITIQIIKEQPTGNDEWLLERLNGIKEMMNK